MKNTVVRPISRLHFKTGSSRQVLTRGVADHRCSCRAASRSALPRLHAGFLAPLHAHKSPRSRALSRAVSSPGATHCSGPRLHAPGAPALARSAPHTHASACRAVSRNVLPRLYAGAPALARSAPCVHVSACIHKHRTEQLSIRVQATDRPGAVPCQWLLGTERCRRQQ
jgi:hypothetical protein